MELEEALAECTSYEDMVMKYPALANHYCRVVKDWYLIKLREAKYSKPRVVWAYGGSGTGKSSLAYYMCGPKRFRKVGPLDWFDGYHG